VLTWVPSFKRRDHESHVALRISHAPLLGSFTLALVRIISPLLTISSNLRQVAAEEISKVLKERILEGFVRGRKPGEISDEYFALVGIFEGKAHIDLDKSIITTGLLVDGSVDYKTEHAPQTSQSPNTDASTNEESV